MQVKDNPKTYRQAFNKTLNKRAVKEEKYNAVKTSTKYKKAGPSITFKYKAVNTSTK